METETVNPLRTMSKEAEDDLIRAAMAAQESSKAPVVIPGKTPLWKWTSEEVRLLKHAASLILGKNGGVCWDRLHIDWEDAYNVLTRKGHRPMRALMQKYHQLARDASGKPPPPSKRPKGGKLGRPRNPAPVELPTIGAMSATSSNGAKAQVIPNYCPHCGGDIFKVYVALNAP